MEKNNKAVVGSIQIVSIRVTLAALLFALVLLIYESWLTVLKYKSSKENCENEYYIL